MAEHVAERVGQAEAAHMKKHPPCQGDASVDSVVNVVDKPDEYSDEIVNVIV